MLFWGIESLFSSTRDGLTNARRDTTATQAVDSLPEDKECVVLGVAPTPGGSECGLSRLEPTEPPAPSSPYRTLIFGTSATSRVDSARAHFCSHFFARASPSKRFPAPQAPSCQPRAAEEIFQQRSGGPFCVRKCGLAAHLGGFPCRWPGWKTTPGRALTTCHECATCERLAAP